jgi:hypothetical protein
MGNVDPLTRARNASADAEQTFGAVRDQHLVAVQAYATLALADAVTAFTALTALTASTAADRSQAVEATERQTITVDLATGEWLNPDLSITTEEAEVVASAVLPGTSPELVAGWYSAWLSDEQAPARAHDVIRGYL